MEIFEKYDDVVFYILNKERFQEYQAIEAEAKVGNVTPLIPFVQKMVDDLTNFNNHMTKARKDFYDYYGQFTAIKSLKRSQTPKIKLRKNYLTILLRQWQVNPSTIPTNEFLDHFLHWHCAEYFADHWFLLSNKYLFFSKDFFQHIKKNSSYIQKAIDDLELPPVFLPLDRSLETDFDSEESDYHEIDATHAAELLKDFHEESLNEKFKLQIQYYKDMLQKKIEDKVYVLVRFVD